MVASPPGLSQTEVADCSRQREDLGAGAAHLQDQAEGASGGGGEAGSEAGGEAGRVLDGVHDPVGRAGRGRGSQARNSQPSQQHSPHAI